MGPRKKQAKPRSITFLRPNLSDVKPRGIDISIVEIPEAEARKPIKTTEAPISLE
jgi:hypothetical protein